MKKIALGVLFLLGGLTANAQDVTVDQIIDQYLENIGGRDAWTKLEGFKMNASAAAQGMDIPIEVVELKDGRKYTRITFQGNSFKQDVYDGETLWSTSFMTMQPEKAESEQTENFKRSLGEFPDVLMHYKDLGYTVELDGEDVKEGVDCHKLKVTRKPQLVEGEEKQNIVYYYMDKENFIPIATEAEVMSGPMKGQMAASLFSDYQEVDGLYFPFSISQGGMFELTIDTIELNPKIDDSEFAFPAEGK